MTLKKAIELLNNSNNITIETATDAVNVAYQEGLVARKRTIPYPEAEVEKIWIAVETICNVTREEVKGIGRKQGLMDAKKIASFEFYQIFENQNKVGRIMEKDHSSVFHHLHKYEDLFLTDRQFRNKALRVKELL